MKSDRQHHNLTHLEQIRGDRFRGQDRPAETANNERLFRMEQRT
jgi:hypothetical protein